MIFHVFGGKCAGKTTVTSQLDKNEFATWDIREDFYIAEGILKNDKMDWDAWRQKEHKIQEVVSEFIKNNSDKHIVIESSGFNRLLNTTIKWENPEAKEGRRKIIPVNMGMPTDEDTSLRAEKENLNVQETVKYNQNMRVNRYIPIKNLLPEKMNSPEEALEFIKKTISKED